VGTLTFHGHATAELQSAGSVRLLIDPFFTDNPLSDVGPDYFAEGLDYVLLTHGHFDHVADAWPAGGSGSLRLLETTGATLIATAEIVGYANDVLGHAATHAMHIGGGFDFPFGRVRLVTAVHGGMVAGEGAGPYTTNPAGILLELDGTRILHAGDTALTRDMELLNGKVDVALLPIGDNFTMGPEDAARAAEMIGPDIVIPIHYNSWDVIRQDPLEFARLVGDTAEVVIMSARDTFDF